MKCSLTDSIQSAVALTQKLPAAARWQMPIRALWLGMLLVLGFNLVALGGWSVTTRGKCKWYSKTYVARAHNGCGIFLLHDESSHGCGDVYASAGPNNCIVGDSGAWASNGPGGGTGNYWRHGGGWAGSPSTTNAPPGSTSTNYVTSHVTFDSVARTVTVNVDYAMLAVTPNGAVSQLEILLWQEVYDGDEQPTPAKTLWAGKLKLDANGPSATGQLSGIYVPVRSIMLGTNAGIITEMTNWVVSVPVPVSADFDSLALTVRADGGEVDVVPPVLASFDVPPTPVTALLSNTATFTAVGAGDAPIFYTWMRGSNVVGTGSSVSFSNVTAASAFTNLVCVVSNDFSTATSPVVSLTVLPDNDRDQMADFWETAFALNPASAADAAQNADGDALSNLQEFQAGSSPRSTNNLIRILGIQARTNSNVMVLTYRTAPGMPQLSATNYTIRSTTGYRVAIAGVKHGSRATDIILTLAEPLPAEGGFTLTTASSPATYEFNGDTPPTSGLTINCSSNITVYTSSANGSDVVLKSEACNGAGLDTAYLWKWRLLPSGTFTTIASGSIVAPDFDWDNIGDPYCVTLDAVQTLAPGTYEIVLTVSDASPTSVSCTNTVTVVLNSTPPTIVCPSSITNTSCSSNIVVTYPNPVVTGGALLSCTPPTGSLFPQGTTTVTCLAVDPSGTLTNSCSFTVTVVRDTIPPMINCSTNKTVFGPGWSFDTPTATDNLCSNVTVYVLKTVSNGVCPLVITRTWVAADCCGNTNICQQSVSIVDTNPPVFVGGCNTNVFFAGGNTSFVTPTAASPRPALLARLQQLGITSTRGFDECAVNKWFAHSFTNLPKCITAAYLEIRVKPCGDICGNDAMHFWFTGSANSNAVFSQYFGGGNPRAGLATNDWCSYAGNPQTFVLDLSNLPASGGGPANILSLLEANGFLDVTLQDDTGVDYVKLTVVSCCGNATKTVECGTRWFFDTPVAVDDTCPNPTVTVLKTVTNGICPKVITRTWVATDCCGNTNTTSQEVTLVDTTPPVISTPGNLTFYTCDSSKVVKFNVTAYDACAGKVTPVCNPPSGSSFGVGTTTVNCTATDACGNTTSTTFTVTIVNTMTKQTITLGTKDCFTLPEEASTRSAQLNAKYPGVNWKNFDSFAQDRPFGASFMKLPKNLTCAVLEITMRPGASSLTTNDAIAAVLGTNGAFAWSSYIGGGLGSSLTPAPWHNQAGCGQTFTIDLGAYLPTINALNQVDVYVQDDTAVDYVSLTYCYCDTNLWWKNNNWYLRNADPYISKDWMTLVAATPSSNLTATVDLAGAAAFKLNLGDLDLSADPAAAFTFGAGSIGNPSGSAVTLKPVGNYIGLSVGAFSGAVNTVRVVTANGDAVVSDTTMSPGSAAGYISILDTGGWVVAGAQTAVATQSPLAPTNGVEAAYTIKLNQAVNIRSCTNCAPVLADTITVLLLKNPDTTPDLLTEVTVSATGMPEVNIGNVATKIGEAWVRSSGEANAAAAGNQLSLTPQDGASTNSVRMLLAVPATNRLDLAASIAQNTITLSPQSATVQISLHMPALEFGLGSSGQDGVAIGLGSSGQDGIGLGSSGQDGVWIGSSGEDGYWLGSCGEDGPCFTFAQTGNGMDITPNFTPLGASTTLFSVYNGGVKVADVNSAGSASIMGLPVQLPPLRYFIGSSGQDGVMVANWVGEQTIVINGNTYAGNELRITPVAPDLHPTTVSGIRVEATGVDALTLHSLAVPAAQWRMLPLQVEAGTLNVQWTGPAGAALESAPTLNGTWTAVPNQNALSAKLPAPGGTNAPAMLFRMHAN